MLCHLERCQTTALTAEKKGLFMGYCTDAQMKKYAYFCAFWPCQPQSQTVTCLGRSCMQRSHWSTLKLQSICHVFMVLSGVQRSYIWTARTWTWSTAQPWLLAKLSHALTCMSSNLHIDAYGLLYNEVHTRHYLWGQWWWCLCIGTWMELSISFSNLIHLYIQRFGCPCLKRLHARLGIQRIWQVRLRTLDTHDMLMHFCTYGVM